MARSAWERKAPDAYWSQGDTSPAITEQLLRDGAVVDLTNAQGVRFQGLFADEASSRRSIDRPATVVGAGANGTVSYTPIAADTAVIGDLMVQWRVTHQNGSIERFPNSGHQKVRITKGAVRARRWA